MAYRQRQTITSNVNAHRCPNQGPCKSFPHPQRLSPQSVCFHRYEQLVLVGMRSSRRQTRIAQTTPNCTSLQLRRSNSGKKVISSNTYGSQGKANSLASHPVHLSQVWAYVRQKLTHPFGSPMFNPRDRYILCGTRSMHTRGTDCEIPEDHLAAQWFTQQR